ncbi:MAG TPA: hypothetical protein VGD01_17195 [Candidatus Elarobacter sp.]|jgi:hypothetical protein
MATTTRQKPAAAGAQRRRRPIHAATAAAVLPVALALIPGAGQSANPNCGVHCGVERWQAKTLSYEGATALKMTPVTSSVSQLVAEIAPGGTSEVRVAPVETQEVTVNAQLIGYKVEGDRDLHIVIQDLKTADTMIVEIPNPECSGVCSSIARDQIVSARTAFETAFAGAPPSAAFKALSKPVQVVVTGFPLFDFKHPTPQTGLAPNCIEIHPVLSITLPSDQPLTAVTGHEPKAPAGVTYHCMPRVESDE